MLKYYSVLLVLILLGLPSHSQEVWQYPYEELFDSGLALWENQSGDKGQWIHENGYAKIDITSYGSGREPVWMVGPTFVMDQVDSAVLSFRYKMTGDENPHIIIFMSVNGDVWQNIWDLYGDQGGYMAIKEGTTGKIYSYTSYWKVTIEVI